MKVYKLQDINNLHDRLQTAVCDLYGRWLDEREYEDFNDYQDAASRIVSNMGLEFKVKLTRRPFGIKFRVPYEFSTGRVRMTEFHFLVKKNLYLWTGKTVGPAIQTQ